MKLMTFNTQHCLNFRTKEIDYDLMASTVCAFSPDIVALNEMRSSVPDDSDPYDAQVSILAERAGYPHSAFAAAIGIFLGKEGKRCLYGNGILSRLPILDTETVLIPSPAPTGGRNYERRCLLCARLAGGYTLLVTHFGLSPEEQKNAVNAILPRLADKKCILMGDFNVTPDDAVLAPIRARMKDTADAFSSPFMSYPSDAPLKKIDYIFVSPDLVVESAEIPSVVASDHRPHIAMIRD